ncbi:metalloregulator ArsR/SmtB family transcription factor [Gordonia sp. (in: high G+C Gram-positive bacteria)]|uniref:ArsR/SmtB family transcription factor n=1 Tax=Gordonia sp. (in: high G+C Gram-positive bacteria) TaxID=84139 RepID=UPI0019881F4D|nr:metalloregulator ArsR/SmtB family transcription factor [Gordonia sp. (in: high G+C Gram-positive bacteria)]MBD0023858.1 winged helix-turn-helix transcriptional regulator [Gordonia sp. (in: high G+C Gram-positive bacteria)]
MSTPVTPDGPAAREAASELLRALASPTRIGIVLSLRSGSRCVHELVGELGLSQPLVSQHLRVLKDADVVRGRRNGREIMYELVDDHLAHIVTDALVHASEPNESESNRSESNRSESNRSESNRSESNRSAAVPGIAGTPRAHR